MKTLYALSLASLLALTSSAFAQEQAAAPANSQAQATQTEQEKPEPAWKKEARKWEQENEEAKKKGYW